MAWLRVASHTGTSTNAVQMLRQIAERKCLGRKGGARGSALMSEANYSTVLRYARENEQSRRSEVVRQRPMNRGARTP